MSNDVTSLIYTRVDSDPVFEPSLISSFRNPHYQKESSMARERVTEGGGESSDVDVGANNNPRVYKVMENVSCTSYML